MQLVIWSCWIVSFLTKETYYRMNLYAYTLDWIFIEMQIAFLSIVYMLKWKKKNNNCKNRTDLPFISHINSKQKHADKNTT